MVYSWQIMKCFLLNYYFRYYKDIILLMHKSCKKSNGTLEARREIPFILNRSIALFQLGQDVKLYLFLDV